MGGNQADTFQFWDAYVFAGNIDGADGLDYLDYQNYGSGVTVTLEDATPTVLSGVADGVSGTFTHIENYTGSTHADTLVGPDSGATFNLTAPDAGNVDTVFFFTSVENLTGGSSLSDTLNFSTYVGPLTINLELGTLSGLGGNFSGFENITGNTASSLIGPNSGATFNITGPDEVNVDGIYFFT